MARVASVICVSHTPYLFLPPQQWTSAQQKRAAAGGFREPFELDTLDTNTAKHERCRRALDVLKARLEADAPDFLIIFGDDQNEQFQFSNFPAFALFTGEKFGGYKISRWEGVPLPDGRRPERPKTPEHWTEMANRADVARHLLKGLVGHGFDIAFCGALADPDEGMGHAFFRPSYFLDPQYSLPVVPILINCFYGPQPSGRRCYELGRAVAELVSALPGDARATVIGSGGLWHTPLMPRSYLNPEFDLGVLGFIERGDAAGLAAFFDAYPQPFDLSTDQGLALASGGTAWSRVSAAVSAKRATGSPRPPSRRAGRARVIDYVQIGASPVGVGFAISIWIDGDIVDVQ